MRDTDFFSNFFVVMDPASKKSFRGQFDNEIGEFGQLIRSELEVTGLNIRHLDGGRIPGTLFWNTVCDPFCLSSDTLDILVNNGLTGWSAIPVTVKDKNEKTWDNYSTLIISGRADAIDYLESDITFNNFPGGLYPYFKGLYFKPDSWDGSDIFMSRADKFGKITTFIYVTRKFVNAFKRAKIKNIKFVNFNDFEVSCETIIIGGNDEYVTKLKDKITKASA